MAVADPCKHCCTGPELWEGTPGSFPYPLGDVPCFAHLDPRLPVFPNLYPNPRAIPYLARARSIAVRRFWGTRLITNLVDDTKIQSLVFVTYQHSCLPPLNLMIHGSRLTRHTFGKMTSPQESKPLASLGQFTAPTPVLASHKTQPSTPVSNVP